MRDIGCCCPDLWSASCYLCAYSLAPEVRRAAADWDALRFGNDFFCNNGAHLILHQCGAPTSLCNRGRNGSLKRVDLMSTNPPEQLSAERARTRPIR